MLAILAIVDEQGRKGPYFIFSAVHTGSSFQHEGQVRTSPNRPIIAIGMGRTNWAGAIYGSKYTLTSLSVPAPISDLLVLGLLCLHLTPMWPPYCKIRRYFRRFCPRVGQPLLAKAGRMLPPARLLPGEKWW